jgi:threonine dehydrogenase-like Zn-dependent dehydrogenase
MLALTFDIHPIRWPLCKAAGRLTPRSFTSMLSGLRLTEVPTPALPSPRWVRLRTVLGGICGTDLATLFYRNHPASFLRSLTSFPAVLGHEVVAVVDEVGERVTRVAPGDRVCVEPALSCVPRDIEPVCAHCAAGQTALCEHFNGGTLPPGMMIGFNSFTGGSWAPSFVAHESQLYRVPDAVDDETAVLVDPIACAVHAVLRRRPDDERVLILGGGIIGTGVTAAIRALGSAATVVALVRHERQAETARRYGANDVLVMPRAMATAERYDQVARHVGGRRVDGLFGNHGMIGGFDLVYDCVGTGASLTDAMKFTRSRGTVVVAGTAQITRVDTTPLWFSELQLIGCFGRQIESYNGMSRHTFEVVFDLIQSGKLDLSGLLTHRFRLEDYKHALAAHTARGKNGLIKAAFVPNASR